MTSRVTPARGGELADLAVAVGRTLGLSGAALEALGHIVRACGDYDALRSGRDGRDVLSDDDALEELRREAGSRLDPRVVGALIDVLHPARAPFPSSAR